MAGRMMRDFLRMVDEFLRGQGRFALEAPPAGRLRWLIVFVAAFGLVYGAVMGAFSGLTPGRYHQLLYSAVKVPLLLLATFALCLPSYFVLNSVLGLRSDFDRALRAVAATQACVAIVLASLAPLTALFYASYDDYSLAVNFNGVMFAVACVMAQVVVRRYYVPLMRRAPRHRTMMHVWFFLYVFVGIQMAWVLKPFVGDPRVPVRFFKPEELGNAYVVISSLVWQFVQQLLGM
jgi:hypothetical protein